MNKHVLDLVPPPVMTSIAVLHYASEAPPELNLQVRKSSDKAGLGELEASIRTHGVIVPMLTKEHKGKLYVTAGNRRLKLMRKIHGQDATVEVQTIDSDKIKGDPREIAMATNLGLPPHPVDRYEVIALLVKEGMSPADAQAHFGLTGQAFAQIMRLGKMAPVVRNAWRNGEIDADVVKAFALTDDVKEQEKVYASSKKNSHQGIIRAFEVASRFVGQQHEAGPLVEFVGLAECEAAKIKVNRDLFGTQHTVSDMKALRRLADRLLSEVCSDLRSQGWAWAATEESLGSERYQYGKIDPSGAKPSKDEEARLEQLQTLLADPDLPDSDVKKLEEEQSAINEAVKARGYTADQRKKTGCIIKISRHGRLEIEYGRVKPEERKQIEGAARRAAASPAAGKGKKKGPFTDVGSAALAQRLSSALTRAAGMTIVREPSVGVSALIAGFASRDRAVGVNISGDMSKPADFVKTFEGNLAGSTPNREMLLAQIAARALQFTVHNPLSVPMKDPAVAAICNALMPSKMNEALRECFDAKDYFGSVGKEAIFQAVLESMGEEHAIKVGKMNRSAGADFALANVPRTKWLPPWLRTAHYDGPAASKLVKKAPPNKHVAKHKAAKVKKLAKKAAKAKKAKRK